MTAESLVVDATPTDDDVVPKRYLRAVVVVAHAARRREYVVAHFGSASFWRTDRLGALAVRALIAGRSDDEAMDLVERIEAGAGERARDLFFALDSKGAMTRQPPSRAGRRLRVRRLVSRAMGPFMSAMGPVVRLAPTPLLVWMLEVWPSTMPGRHVWRSNRHVVINALRNSGYADRPESWLNDVSRRWAAHKRSYLFMYMSVGLSPARLAQLVDRLFNRESADAVAAQLQAAGPTVGAFLHGPLCVAVPNALRARGHEVVRSAVPGTHGTHVSETSRPIRDFFGDSPEMAVDVSDPLGSATLLRHLKAGRSVYVSLDEPANERKPAAEIEVLGQRWVRNDWPAWIAVRSGRPLALWSTHSSPNGVVLTSSPLLHPDLSLPVELRVAELSTRLYTFAETAIREHPGEWVGWIYLNTLIKTRNFASVPSALSSPA
jgi:hypothetical protein